MAVLSTVGLTLLSAFAGLTAADCECGYSASIDGTPQVFTDLIETDFAHLSSISTNTDWIRQAFNITSDKARGSYGEMYAVENMRTATNANSKSEDGNSKNGLPAGLELTVKSSLINDMVPVAEIDSNRTDILYGTFRAGMKLTGVSGTCSAFFWVRINSDNGDEAKTRRLTVTFR